MQLIETTNVNHALIAGIETLQKYGKRHHSRNGPILVCPWPVITVFHKPIERVLFNRERDANPFFHLFEAIWMLAGRNDVTFVSQFVERMKEYSDDGETLEGAYGYRWRNWWRKDQLLEIIYQLQQDPDSRRAVLTMWDVADLFAESKDKPCNTHIYFRIVYGKLDMSVCNRSNDIIWGLYGANTVHLSILHEFIASAVGVDLGIYCHFSNNFHLYPGAVPYRDILAGGIDDLYNPNRDDSVETHGLFGEPKDYQTFLDNCEAVCDDPKNAMYMNGVFFPHIVYPMWMVWKTRHKKWLNEILASSNLNTAAGLT